MHVDPKRSCPSNGSYLKPSALHSSTPSGLDTYCGPIMGLGVGFGSGSLGPFMGPEEH